MSFETVQSLHRRPKLEKTEGSVLVRIGATGAAYLSLSCSLAAFQAIGVQPDSKVDILIGRGDDYGRVVLKRGTFFSPIAQSKNTMSVGTVKHGLSLRKSKAVRVPIEISDGNILFTIPQSFFATEEATASPPELLNQVAE